MMPVLLVLVVIISIYSLTLKHTDSSGQVHTGIQGFLYYLTPNLEGLTVQRFLQILLAAKTFGRETNIRLGPAPIPSVPENTNTAGMIMAPARNATPVSKISI